MSRFVAVLGVGLRSGVEYSGKDVSGGSKIGLRSGLVVVLGVVLIGGVTPGLGLVGPVGAAEGVSSSGDGEFGFLGGGGGFSDVSEAGMHRANVETLTERGILDGTECAPGRFCPDEPIKRWVMAVWLVRAVDEVDPGAVEKSRFLDVDAEDWWMPVVERLADLGITRGCDLELARFCPTEVVTRQQMASFLVRAFELEPVLGNKFADVGVGNSHVADINALAGEGITAGCETEPDRYCPLRDTTRAQMATFLARALGIDSIPDPEVITVRVEGTPLPTEGDFTAIVSGASHICGLLSDGSVVCWGSNNAGQTEPPDGAFVAIASGRAFSCGLDTAGAATCWGANDSAQLDVPKGRFVSIVAGGWHVCGIKTDQTLSCWGRNTSGQADPPEGQFVEIAAGITHSCGLSTDHTVVCWGSNDDGLSDPPTGALMGLAAGGFHSCGVDTEDAAMCWGHNGWGQTDAPPESFTALASGQSHSCGIRTDRTVSCWGRNQTGQSDPPKGEFSAVTAGKYHTCGVRTSGIVTCWGRNPQDRQDPGEGPFTAVASGWSHSCAVRQDRRVICWGDNGHDQGDPPPGSFQTVAVGDYHSCGIRTDRTVACWGGNWIGQGLAPEGEFHAVAGGAAHSCGIRTDQTVVCWGDNGDGEADPPAGAFTAITAGTFHSCGIRTDQTVVCWGSNNVGQQPAPAGTYVRIDAGKNHTCGIRTDQTIVCWGYHWDGRTVAPQGQFLEVAAGHTHSCGLRTDNTIVCWGADHKGETEPPRGLFTAVATGRSYSCGLRTDGIVSCWGKQLVRSAPPEVEFFNRRHLPDPDVCRPPSVSEGVTVGFPLPGRSFSSEGTIRVAVLFMDFPDAEATHATEQEAAGGLPYAKKYLETASYQQFKPHFEPLHGWLRAGHDYSHYLEDLGLSDMGLSDAVVEEAVQLADPEFDFTDIDSVMVVMPSSHFGGGSQKGRRITTDERTVRNITWINNFPYDEPVDPQTWGLAGAHELVHTLGLADLYPFDGNRHRHPYPPPGVWVETELGLMGLHSYFHAAETDPRLAYRVVFRNGDRRTDYTERLEAAEMLAWSRWQLGWLKPAQIHCVTQLETQTTITLSPVISPGAEPAMVAIPVSETEVIVIESRRKRGYDAGQEHQWSNGAETTFPGLPEEGILVYTVDTSIETGQLPIKVASDPGNGHLENEPILTEGESVTIGNYTITLKTHTYHTDTITITIGK